MYYLIPANSKKGQLIFNIFKGIDLALLLIGIGITVILLFAVEDDTLTATIIKLLPAAIAGLLVMPMPFYHNGRVFIREMYLFFTRQSKYLWRGWCAWYDNE